MKTRYVAIVMALLMGVHSLCACELCGDKRQRHPFSLNALVMAAAAQMFGSYDFGSYLDDSTDLDDDSMHVSSSDAVSTSSDNQDPVVPIYLMGEDYSNPEDQDFFAAISAAAIRRLVIWAPEGVGYEEIDGVPLMGEGLPAYGTENFFALTVAHLLVLRSMINQISDEEVFPVIAQEQMLNIFTDLINQVIDPNNRAFTKMLYDDPILKETVLFKWILGSMKSLLSLEDSKRGPRLKELWKDILEKKHLKFFKNIEPFLNRAIALLLSQVSALPGHLQIPPGNIEVLRNVKELKISYVCRVMSRWRYLFIVENLEKLHRYAREQGLPLVVLFGFPHVGPIREGLEAVGLAVVSGPSDLPLSEAVKKAKQARMDKNTG